MIDSYGIGRLSKGAHEMPCSVYLDSRTGKVMVMLEQVDRAEQDGNVFRFYAGKDLVAVFLADKIFGYEMTSGPVIAE